MRRLMAMQNRPTAVFIADPMLAAGAIQEAHGMGIRIPADLSVVGVDDSDVRFWTVPKMTAVCQDASELGRRAVVLLREMVEADHPEPTRIQTSAWLEVRGSTAPLGEANLTAERLRRRRDSDGRKKG